MSHPLEGLTSAPDPRDPRASGLLQPIDGSRASLGESHGGPPAGTRAPDALGSIEPAGGASEPGKRADPKADPHGAAGSVPARERAHPTDLPGALPTENARAVDSIGRGWSIVGVPYDGGIPSRPGARFGPRALRAALSAFGTYDGDHQLQPITDLGDLALPSMNGARAHSRIEEAAKRLFADRHRPLFIGGDHGCTGSILRGLAAARPSVRLALITIDAHLDVREYDDEDSLSSGTPFRRALETPVIDGSRVAMLGIRRFANSRYYLDWAREQRIQLRTVEEISDKGAPAVAQEALTAVGADADAIYLSVDIDAADAAYAPGVSATGIGGLTAREMIDIVRTVAADPRLIGADIMELSPPYDSDDRTARLAARLALEIVGGQS